MEIRDVCVENNKYSFEFPLEEIYPGYRRTLQPPECPYYLSKRSDNNTTQTVPLFLQEEISDSNNEESLIKIVPSSYNDFSYLKDRLSNEKLDHKFNLMPDTEETNFVYERIKLFHPVEKEEKRNHNEALKERILKVGWTYSSPIKDKIPCKGISKISLKNYPEPKADQYLLFYKACKSLNKELKDKLYKLKIKKNHM
ncbi:hypothetical protein ILUMI_04181 [Ignelater luminosus]|uniref:Uncharacterized protein n=1 Tax=Ignelater luminosus TaxID=2038154 RepID=A0A8K0DDB6_IGNLU|nr:hypothetical protein ILUMI_04181 [Ignelater luminosus]